jgi:rhamnulokinase
MSKTANFLAADLGASNGRVLLGRWNGERFEAGRNCIASPTARRPYSGACIGTCWHCGAKSSMGMARYASPTRRRWQASASTPGASTLGCFDATGRLLGNPVHYRDARTNGMVEHALCAHPQTEDLRLTTGSAVSPVEHAFPAVSMRVAG